MKKYIALVPTEEENSICLEIVYLEGGTNLVTGCVESRGYYLYCTPVMVEAHSIQGGREYRTFRKIFGKGRKALLLEATHRSKKAEKTAELLAEENVDWLVSEVLALYGLKLAETEEKKDAE